MEVRATGKKARRRSIATMLTLAAPKRRVRATSTGPRRCWQRQCRKRKDCVLLLLLRRLLLSSSTKGSFSLSLSSQLFRDSIQLYALPYWLHQANDRRERRGSALYCTAFSSCLSFVLDAPHCTYSGPPNVRRSLDETRSPFRTQRTVSRKSIFFFLSRGGGP
jgi:hypothetical protein